MNLKNHIFYFGSLLLIDIGILDFFINKSREEYTAKILGLPQWTYIPYLSLEHLLGFLAISLFFFYLCLLAGLVISYTNQNKKKLGPRFNFSNSISIFGALVVSLYYEILVQNMMTCWQIPLDLMGIYLYYLYILYVFPTYDKAF